jgi:hypothetical protein
MANFELKDCQHFVADVTTSYPDIDKFAVDANGEAPRNHVLHIAEAAIKTLEYLHGDVDQVALGHYWEGAILLKMFGRANVLFRNLEGWGPIGEKLQHAYKTLKENSGATNVYHCHLNPGSNPVWVVEWQVDDDGVITVLRIETHGRMNGKWTKKVDPSAAKTAEKQKARRVAAKAALRAKIEAQNLGREPDSE